MPETSIQIWGLVAGYGLLIIPLWILLWIQVPIVSKVIISAVRMTVQLLLVGFYLQVVFAFNRPWLNCLWILVMIFVADVSILRSSGLRVRRLALPLFLSLVIGVAVPLLYFIWIILQKPGLLEARFVIPIGGMILGSCLRGNIIGIRCFYQSILQGEKVFCQQLANGATLAEATRPYLRRALEESLSPTLATMATVGVVSLPGMMTGVILGGSDPRTAVMYQIAIMFALFTGISITILLGILSTRRVGFDAFGMLKRDIFRS